MKVRSIILVISIVLASSCLKAQALMNAAAKMLNSGDIVFTSEINTVEKKKEAKKIETYTPDQTVFATFYMNRKLGTHASFYNSDARFYTTVYLKTKDGEQMSLSVDLKQDDKDKKFACVELIPAKLSPDKYDHKALADFFGKLKPGVHSITFYIEDEKNIAGKVDFDLSKGSGKFGELDKQIKEEAAKKAAEEQKKYEEEQKKRNEAVKKFQSSADVVKIAFKNKCDNPGNIYVSTGDDYTSFSLNLNKGEQSNYVICRPGNKVYLGNDVIHTVSAASKNKVIEFCPPKTEAQINEEKFQDGWESISVSVNNKCGDKVYYLVEQGGSTSNSFMNGNSSTSVSSLKKGNKIWLSDDKRNKISVLFEATSYTQKGTEVILCR